MISLDILKTFAINEWQQGHQTGLKQNIFFIVSCSWFVFRSYCQVKNQCLSKSSGQDSFCWFFSEVVARSKTNTCLDQRFKTLCWFVFQKLLLGQESMLVQIKCSRIFTGFFSKVVTKSRTNACLDQAVKTLCQFFFSKVVARSRTNACPDQTVKTLCWFFFRSCCQVKNQCLSRSSGQDSLLDCFQKLLLGQEPMLVNWSPISSRECWNVNVE